MAWRIVHDRIVRRQQHRIDRWLCLYLFVRHYYFSAQNEATMTIIMIAWRKEKKIKRDTWENVWYYWTICFLFVDIASWEIAKDQSIHFQVSQLIKCYNEIQINRISNWKSFNKTKTKQPKWFAIRWQIFCVKRNAWLKFNLNKNHFVEFPFVRSFVRWVDVFGDDMSTQKNCDRKQNDFNIVLIRENADYINMIGMGHNGINFRNIWWVSVVKNLFHRVKVTFSCDYLCHFSNEKSKKKQLFRIT